MRGAKCGVAKCSDLHGTSKAESGRPAWSIAGGPHSCADSPVGGIAIGILSLLLGHCAAQSHAIPASIGGRLLPFPK